MAKLIFKYGTLTSGKSLDLLKVYDSYKRQGKNILLTTSSIDTRTGKGIVSSRVGIKEEAFTIDNTEEGRFNLLELIDTLSSEVPLDCIVVDEAQFLSRSIIESLSRVVDKLNIPVICYGLKNDFQNNLFEGSEALLIYADKIEEVKSVCNYCNHKATMNARVDAKGKRVTDGEQIVLGAEDKYIAVCRYHYNQLAKGPIRKGTVQYIYGDKLWEI